MQDDPFPPTPARTPSSDVFGVRLRESGRDWAHERIERHNITKTELVKAALAFAAANSNEFDELIKARKDKNT